MVLLGVLVRGEMARTCHAPGGRRSLGWKPGVLDEEVVHVALAPGSLMAEQQDRVALAEIEWCGELMIAAAAVGDERLSPARIDEVLNVQRCPVARVPAQGQRLPVR